MQPIKEETNGKKEKNVNRRKNPTKQDSEQQIIKFT